MEMRVLSRQGDSITGTVKKRGVTRNTVHEHLRDPPPRRYGLRLLRVTKFDPFMRLWPDGCRLCQYCAEDFDDDPFKILARYIDQCVNRSTHNFNRCQYCRLGLVRE